MCILSVYTLLKVDGYFDLSVLSMSVMGLKKKFGWGVGGWGELYPSFLDFWISFNFAKPLIIALSNKNIQIQTRCHRRLPK